MTENRGYQRSYGPSRVLHIRNLPDSTLEDDLEDLGRAFGSVVRSLVINSSHQGFLEMSSLEEAKEFKSAHRNRPAFIHNKQVQIEYSNRSEIKPHDKRRASSRGRAARPRSRRSRSPPRRGWGRPPSPRRSPVRGTGNIGYQLPLAPPPIELAYASGPVVTSFPSVQLAPQTLPIQTKVVTQQPLSQDLSRVLHVRGLPSGCTDQQLVNLVLTLTVGEAVKTLIFPNKHQGFVELDSEDSAAEVIQSVASHPATLEGNQLFFAFSRRREITEDMVRPTRPTNGNSNPNQPTTIENRGDFSPPRQQINPPLLPAIVSQQNPLMGPPQHGANGPHVSSPQILPPLSLLGEPRGRPAFGPTAHLRPMEPRHPRFDGFDGDMRDGDQRRSSGVVPSYGLAQPGCVLFLLGLDAETVTSDKLRALFGNYGDVMKVKVMFKNKSSALLQMATPDQAGRAMQYIDGIRINGKRIKVMISRNFDINVKERREEGYSDLNKDYSNDRTLQRFKYVDSQNVKHICPPGPVLHVSNLARGTEESELLELFGTENVAKVHFFKNSSNMALIKCVSTDAAIDMLMDHDCGSFKSRKLRISFSRHEMR